MSAVSRAFAVLDAFSDESTALRLTTIARRAGLPVPTTLRLVRELVSWGGLERQADGSYRLGTRLWAIGARVPCTRRLVEAGRPHLRRLHAATGHAVHLAVAHGRSALVVDELGGTVRTGDHLPLHATAAGKVLLAHAAAPLRLEILTGRGGSAGTGRGGLVRLTPHTITAPGLLDRQLAAIRAGSPATADEEWKPGRREIAAAVPMPDGRQVAALALTAPSAAAVRRAAPQLVRAAAAIRSALAAASPSAAAHPGG